MPKFNRAALQAYIGKVHKLAERECAVHPISFGYPININKLEPLDNVRQALRPHYILNNCGDPFNHSKCHWQMHSLAQEKDLIKYMGTSWGIPISNTEENIWGYCTTGGTEGNMAGIRRGLEAFKRRNPLFVHTREAHYSIPKASASMGIQSAVVDPLSNGEMDLDDFRLTIDQSIRKFGFDSFVIVLTLGTTFRGASDNIHAVNDILRNEFNLDWHDYYIHLDSALTGGYYEYTNGPEIKLGEHMDSVSASAHKWWGGMIGGYICTAERTAVESEPFIKYLGMTDRMVSGSRDGSVPLLWNARILQLDWEEEYQRCQNHLKYFNDQMNQRAGQIICFANENSLISVFPKPSDAVCFQYQLATEDAYAHVVVMPHITKDNIDQFVNDYFNCGCDFKLEATSLDPKNGWPLIN